MVCVPDPERPVPRHRPPAHQRGSHKEGGHAGERAAVHAPAGPALCVLRATGVLLPRPYQQPPQVPVDPTGLCGAPAVVSLPASAGGAARPEQGVHSSSATAAKAGARWSTAQSWSNGSGHGAGAGGGSRSHCSKGDPACSSGWQWGRGRAWWWQLSTFGPGGYGACTSNCPCPWRGGCDRRPQGCNGWPAWRAAWQRVRAVVRVGFAVCEGTLESEFALRRIKLPCKQKHTPQLCTNCG